MASSSATSEERELALVNKVEMRIALASSNDKLAGLLKTYLAPLLLKLASEHLSVRNKIISICQHVNTRVKDPTVQLPVAALLKQFKEQQNTLIRHFDLLYIHQGILRLSYREQADLVPVLIQGIAQDLATANKNGANLFNLLLRALQHYQLPLKGSKEDDALRQTLQMTGDDGKAVSSWFGKLILLLSIRRPTASGSQTAVPPPGLDEEDYQFLTVYGKPDVWDSAVDGGLHLSRTKVIALRFLATGAFNDDERFLPALFASADSNSIIVERGDDILKRAISSVDMSDTSLITRLYSLYLGGSGSSAVTPALQMKILSFLSRSTVSTTFPNQFKEIVIKGLGVDGEGSARGREGSKLRTSIFTYANYFLRNAKQPDLQSVTKLLVGELTEFVGRQGWPAPEAGQDLELRRLAYELIGLSAKAGHIADLNLLDWFFRSLSEDASGRDTAVSIEEGLSSLIGTFSEFTRKDVVESESEDVAMMDHVSAKSECALTYNCVSLLPDLLLNINLILTLSTQAQLICCLNFCCDTWRSQPKTWTRPETRCIVEVPDL
jgi:proteasome component ECM29